MSVGGGRRAVLPCFAFTFIAFPTLLPLHPTSKFQVKSKLHYLLCAVRCAAGCSVAMDTFVVRTLLVPSTMLRLLLKQHNWWPRKMVPVNPDADRTYTSGTSGGEGAGHGGQLEAPQCLPQVA